MGGYDPYSPPPTFVLPGTEIPDVARNIAAAQYYAAEAGIYPQGFVPYISASGQGAYGYPSLSQQYFTQNPSQQFQNIQALAEQQKYTRLGSGEYAPSGHVQGFQPNVATQYQQEQLRAGVPPQFVRGAGELPQSVIQQYYQPVPFGKDVVTSQLVKQYKPAPGTEGFMFGENTLRAALGFWDKEGPYEPGFLGNVFLAQHGQREYGSLYVSTKGSYALVDVKGQVPMGGGPGSFAESPKTITSVYSPQELQAFGSPVVQPSTRQESWLEGAGRFITTFGGMWSPAGAAPQTVLPQYAEAGGLPAPFVTMGAPAVTISGATKPSEYFSSPAFTTLSPEKQAYAKSVVEWGLGAAAVTKAQITAFQPQQQPQPQQEFNLLERLSETYLNPIKASLEPRPGESLTQRFMRTASETPFYLPVPGTLPGFSLKGLANLGQELLKIPSQPIGTSYEGINKAIGQETTYKIIPDVGGMSGWIEKNIVPISIGASIGITGRPTYAQQLQAPIAFTGGVIESVIQRTRNYPVEDVAFFMLPSAFGAGESAIAKIASKAALSEIPIVSAVARGGSMVAGEVGLPTLFKAGMVGLYGIESYGHIMGGEDKSATGYGLRSGDIIHQMLFMGLGAKFAPPTPQAEPYNPWYKPEGRYTIPEKIGMFVKSRLTAYTEVAPESRAAYLEAFEAHKTQRFIQPGQLTEPTFEGLKKVSPEMIEPVKVAMGKQTTVGIGSAFMEAQKTPGSPAILESSSDIDLLANDLTNFKTDIATSKAGGRVIEGEIFIKGEKFVGVDPHSFPGGYPEIPGKPFTPQIEIPPEGESTSFISRLFGEPVKGMPRGPGEIAIGGEDYPGGLTYETLPAQRGRITAAVLQDIAQPGEKGYRLPKDFFRAVELSKEAVFTAKEQGLPGTTIGKLEAEQAIYQRMMGRPITYVPGEGRPVITETFGDIYQRELGIRTGKPTGAFRINIETPYESKGIIPEALGKSSWFTAPSEIITAIPKWKSLSMGGEAYYRASPGISITPYSPSPTYRPSPLPSGVSGYLSFAPPPGYLSRPSRTPSSFVPSSPMPSSPPSISSITGSPPSRTPPSFTPRSTPWATPPTSPITPFTPSRTPPYSPPPYIPPSLTPPPTYRTPPSYIPPSLTPPPTGGGLPTFTGGPSSGLFARRGRRYTEKLLLPSVFEGGGRMFSGSPFTTTKRSKKRKR